MITGLRKFIFSLVVFAATCVLLWFGKIPAEIYSTVTLAVLLIYTTGNIASKITDKKPEEIKPTEEKTP